MPRNRRTVDTEAKQDDLVAAAAQLFLAQGYDTTPIATIAERAGVTTNTVYWYFADKEQLLIAVLDKLVGEKLAAYGQLRGRSFASRLTWVAQQLQEVSQLVATVHARVGQSERINDWHDGFHAAVSELLRTELEDLGVSAKQLDTEADIITFAVEGLITHKSDERTVRAVCGALVNRSASSA